ncbi:MAG: hypothetical protein RL088_3599 [Verrucomicrobiota bacterium]|jgi:hypothetical protein
MKHQFCLAAVFSCVVLVSGDAVAQNQRNAAPAVVLTDAGKTLESKYASLQTALKVEIEAALPRLDDSKIAAWLQAIEAEQGPEKEAAARAKEVAKLQGAGEKLRKMEENLKYGPKTLEDAQADLARARARGEEDPERAKLLKSSESFLASRQKEVDQLVAGIDKARKDVEEARARLPDATKAAEAARQAHEKAMAATWQAMDALGANGILSTSALDLGLAQYKILSEATPLGLAEFAQQSPENQKLIDQLLADKDLMLQMLVADGAAGGKYGQAMKIYTDIQKASPKAKDGVFQRLAMAVSLAHALPVVKRDRPTGADGLEASDTETAGKSSVFIDPVQRYLSYEKWYLAGELQQGFKDLSVWNLIRVVDTTDPDEILAWGRRMLHTLRPDCIPNDGDTLVFVEVVDKEIRYGSDGLKDDLLDRHFMQNILANGGICGRRGFFGRFILQAFGVPSTERVEPGHSTITLWHPGGWQTRLGGDWGKSNRGFYSKMGQGGGSYGADVNFLTSSQARADEAGFMRVKRAQWIASLVGEPWKPGLITYHGKTTGPRPPKPGEIVKPTTWSDLALHEQRRIIARLEALKTKPSTSPSVATKEPSAAGKASVDAKGVITIPSAACSSPTESKRSLYHGGQSDLIVFLDDKAGRTLLHLSRYAKEGDTFEYTFDAPKAGRYQLVASVATPKPNQKLFATANGGAEVEVVLPYTIGLWGETEAVSIDLKAGSNVLKFRGPARVTFGEFTLTPVN